MRRLGSYTDDTGGGASAPAWRPKEKMASHTLHRAAAAESPHLGEMSCWSPDRATAEAYQANQAMGGPALYRVVVEIPRLLDLRGAGSERAIRRVVADALELGGDDRAALMDAQGRTRYPWEWEGYGYRDALAERFDAIQYTDDYPEDAETIVLLRDLVWEQDVEAERL